MRRFMKICFIAGILFVGGCSTGSKDAPVADVNSKDATVSEKTTLKLTIKDEINDKILFDEEVSVDKQVKTLSEFLENAKDLEVEMEDGQYGKTIMGIKGVKTEDFNAGPWWLYESDTNEACIAAGMCAAADALEIKDGDVFIFKFTKEFN